MHRTVLSIVAAGSAMALASAALAQPVSIDVRPTGPSVNVQRGPISAGARPGVSAKIDIDRGTEPPAFILTILHNNDGESQLISTPGNPDFGGVARFTTLMNNLRADAMVDPGDGVPRGVLVINAGDTYLPGPEFNASLDNGIPFFDTIAVERIGYDALIIGNHEFDLGAEVFAQFIAGFTSPPAVLSANLDVTTDPFLAPFAGSPIGLSMVFNFGGEQVGLVGATTADLPFVSSPGLVTIDTAVAAAVQAEIDALTGMGVNKIIIGSHLQGLIEDAAFIAQINDADVVVAGGGSSLLANPGDLLLPGDVATGPYPTLLPDSDGDQIPTVTTTGDYGYIGRLVVSFDADGNVIATEGGAVRVSGVGDDAVESDAGVQMDVSDPVAAAVAALDQNVIATSGVGLNGVRSQIRSRETNLGNLIADSQLWEARRRAADFGAPVADVALANGGGIRNDSVIPAGDITELDTFDILPFGNIVGVIEGVSPERFKEILENAVSRIEGGSGRFAQAAGFSMIVDLEGTAQVIDGDSGEITVAGSRVVSVILDNGRPIVFNGQVVPGADLNLAIVNFLANGGDQYPIADLPFTGLGVTYQRALFNFFTEQLAGSITDVEATEGGEGRITILNADG